jgi:hypothetical protein
MPEDLATLRKQTAEFIGYNPMEVVLLRPQRVADGSGGWKDDPPTALASQTMRKITQPTNSQVFRRTIDGEEVKPDFVLLGEYNADVQNGDYWLEDGRRYDVVYVKDDRRYETWGEAIYRG